MVQQSAGLLELDCAISALDLHDVDIDGQTWLKPTIEGGADNLLAGTPDLPSLSTALMVGGSGVRSISIVSSESLTIGNTPVVPSRGNITRDTNREDAPYEFGESYQQERSWPEEILSLSSPWILRDFQGQTLHIRPFSYDPTRQQLEVYTHLRIRLELDPAPAGPPPGSPLDKDFMTIYDRRFINAGELRYTYLPAVGSMIVICPDEWLQAIAPFVNWKVRSGRPTSVVPLSETGDTATDIQAWLSSQYAIDPFAYVVLVGDASQLPTLVTIFPDAPTLPALADGNYGFLSGADTYPEAIVGRFSAETEEQLSIMLTRSITYEESPVQDGDWYRRAIGVASAEGPGDEGEYDAEHMDNIRSTLLAGDHDQVLRVYDTEDGTTSMLMNELNQGASLVNYAGHGTFSRWQSPVAGGSLAPTFSVTRVNQLVNTSQWPVIVSVACDNGKFMDNNCFAETWLRANDQGTPTGGVAMYAATTLVGWSPPMQMQDEFNHLLGNNTSRSFGALCINGALSMSDSYIFAGSGQMQRFVLFGDPSLRVRTTEPRALAVEHESTYSPQQGAYTVMVPGEPGAQVALTIEGDLAASGLTDQDGRAVLALPATGAPVDLLLVVSADNALPYEATIPQNQPPILQIPLAAQSIPEDTPLVLDSLGAGFSDADGDSIAIFSAHSAATGFTFQFSGQQLTVTPPANWFGSTQITVEFTDFHYVVDAGFSLQVTPINDPPRLLVPFADLETPEDTAVTITAPLTHFSDPEGALLSLTSATSNNGTLAWNGSNLLFTPATDFSGTTMVRLTVSDGDSSLSVDAFSVTVLPLNDAPVYNGSLSQLQVLEDDTLALGDLLQAFDDADGDALLLLDAAVTPGVLLMDGTTASFVPPANWFGQAELQLQVGDGEFSADSGVLTLVVLSVPDAPLQIAPLPNRVMFEDSSLVLDSLLDWFSDGDGDSLFIMDSASSSGLLSQAGDTLILVPEPDFNGPIQVSFSVSDGSLVLEGANFTVQVVPVDDQLVLLNPFDPLVWNEDESIVLDQISSHFYSGDADTLFIVDSWVEQAEFVITPLEDALQLTPPPNWNGTGSLFMTVDDGLDHPLTVEIELDVVAQNDAPFLDFCNAPIEPVSDPAQFLAELGLRLADVDNDVLSLRW
ncbi:MAG: tandem-95 repeat protein, partial [Calditrichaeota bacterium]|nr:tandem-95 repeat protein [Calditrichota bacterium]